MAGARPHKMAIHPTNQQKCRLVSRRSRIRSRRRCTCSSAPSWLQVLFLESFVRVSVAPSQAPFPVKSLPHATCAGVAICAMFPCSPFRGGFFSILLHTYMCMYLPSLHALNCTDIRQSMPPTATCCPETETKPEPSTLNPNPMGCRLQLPFWWQWLGWLVWWGGF